MSRPVDVTAVFTPLDGEFFRVKLALDIAIEQVVQEPGCIQYEITDAQEDRITLTEQWESTELLDAHLRGAAVQDLGESLSALLAKPAEVVRSDQQT
ncbi:antibiotic biosynthesis monooxygenase [Arthrobacter agilis]|uniref:putative quinol monooxygenase n=1 Tax=Arthrobacter agilis TaxID=37921 RepID=UPI000B362C73|nr:antibiotic biosynthesis monooxygenase [Arthrobacter agilis]OUM41631.1 antibiotic biosynthesis monooxygenase [Arthrobacter agilis]PPB47202.1 antibiotic biosynthesis monooxygenase [Arthrobacter agilis]TPV26794.1 antibiotic biosynthesis monooxygenase [Arthrobacter agilis]VDR33096.1 Antibiotic biosynthesis monooxygenase [Arthrobacter agilis]